MAVLSELEPKRVFHYFEEICGIPHGSYNEKEISDYLVAFAKEHGLEYYQDEVYNVVMLIPARQKLFTICPAVSRRSSMVFMSSSVKLPST